MSRIEPAATPTAPPTPQSTPPPAGPDADAVRERAAAETATLIAARPHGNVNRGLKGRVRMARDVPRAERPGDVVIVARSFHPDETFGGGFHGDGRGFSTDAEDSARVRTGVLLRPDSRGDMRSVRGGARSDETRHDGAHGLARRLGYPTALAPQTELPGVVAQSRTHRGTTTLQVNAEGTNPLIPGAPASDTRSTFRVRVEGNELHVSADVRGDAFPAVETFVRDHAGNAVFIGVYQLSEDVGVSDMFLDFQRPMIRANVTIVRDPDTQAFVAVESEGRRYTLDEWNRQFEQADVIEE